MLTNRKELSMQITPDLLDYLMSCAILEAQRAQEMGEVPVGAVISRGDTIIARAHNLTESLQDPSAHAEVIAIRQATSLLKNWRLSETILCVTLEPCTMCIGAVKLARIPVVVFGATDSSIGACGSIYDLTQDKRNGPVPRLVGGVRAEECSAMLSAFFQKSRTGLEVAV